MSTENLPHFLAASRTRAQKPIFILGVTYRAGTNHLGRLLELHPNCVLARPLFEDNLGRGLQHLEAYVHETVHKRWSGEWLPTTGADAALRESLGRGLIEFLLGMGDKEWRSELFHPCTVDDQAPRVRFDKRCVAKTPHPDNLERYSKYFPGCPCIALVRDGRSVVESLVQGFGWDFKTACQTWGWNSQTVIRALSDHDPARGSSILLVRFEDLVREPEPTLRRIMLHSGLDPALYPFDKATAAPVVGSSFHKDQGEVTWKEVERPKGFDPTCRHGHWTRVQHERFLWHTGDLLQQFGYEPYQGSLSLSALRWIARVFPSRVRAIRFRNASK